jgi:hypothetical protein
MIEVQRLTYGNQTHINITGIIIPGTRARLGQYSRSNMIQGFSFLNDELFRKSQIDGRKPMRLIFLLVLCVRDLEAGPVPNDVLNRRSTVVPAAQT